MSDPLLFYVYRLMDLLKFYHQMLCAAIELFMSGYLSGNLCSILYPTTSILLGLEVIHTNLLAFRK